MDEIKNQDTPAEPTAPEGPADTCLADLSPELQAACRAAGWTELTPAQAKSIPYILSGRDVMIQSRTGSGKTGAYILPIMQQIDLTRNVPQALVLVPTRELALQVSQEAQMLSQNSHK